MSDQSPTSPPYGPPPVPPPGSYAPPTYPPQSVPPAPSGYPGPPYAGFAAPATSQYAPGYAGVLDAPPPRESSTLGIVALILSIVAAVVPAVLAAIAGWNVASQSVNRLILDPSSMRSMDLSFLTPVREWVLLGEVSFYAGTALGIWAIVQGIIATVRRRGRAQGVAAIVIASVAPFIFGVTLYMVLVGGVAAGAATFA